MRGRKSKYTPARVKTIEQSIEIGLSYQHAAANAGICAQTMTDWQKKYPEFLERIEAAEARGALANFISVRRAAPGDWRAAAWILEHRHAQHYGKQTIDLTVKGDAEHPVGVVLKRGE